MSTNLISKLVCFRIIVLRHSTRESVSRSVDLDAHPTKPILDSDRVPKLADLQDVIGAAYNIVKWCVRRRVEGVCENLRENFDRNSIDGCRWIPNADALGFPGLYMSGGLDRRLGFNWRRGRRRRILNKCYCELTMKNGWDKHTAVLIIIIIGRA